MPESNADKSARKLIHTRRIAVEGYLRDDGLVELEARLVDVKDQDYTLATGVRRRGDPVHDMLVTLAIDAHFTIVAASARSDAAPYPGACETSAPAYGKLVGLNLLRGFRAAVRELFGGTAGCSHITELLSSVPTAAIQTVATFRHENEETGEKPFQLDRCHALAADQETVRRYYPRWYRARARGGT